MGRSIEYSINRLLVPIPNFFIKGQMKQTDMHVIDKEVY